ncbi:Mms19 [Carabus blaptoides fortunei]
MSSSKIIMESIDLADIFTEISNINKYDSILSLKCASLAQEIKQKKITIHVIVENLGTLLINPATEKRELGTLVLSEVLEYLPDDFLSSTELHFISTFYADRLKDHHQVIPAVLRGLLTLVQMKNLPEGAPAKLLSALFENVPCQQQQLKDRQCIYQIFKELLDRRLTEIQAMGIDFVVGVIQAMDSERDPRNLMLLFNWIPQFLQLTKLGHLTEEMFEVLACYFPVDFKAPLQDSQSVTRDSLAEALCPCLCAIQEFGEFCIPLIVDKLNSTLKLAKFDSLVLLIESCNHFDVSVYEQHIQDIWNILQKDALTSTDAELEEVRLQAISAVIYRLSKSENTTLFKDTIFNLYDSLRLNLRPDTKLFIPSSKILYAAARASKESCDSIVQPIVLLLSNQYNLTTNPAHQEILLRTLMEFVIGYVKLFEVNNIIDVDMLKEVPVLCLEATRHPENGVRVIGFESIGRIAKTLPLNIRENVYELLKYEMIIEEPELVRNSLLKCLKIFASLYKDEITDKILSSKINVTDTMTLELYLETLCSIVSEKSFLDRILPEILDHCTGESIDTSKISIKCLRKLLEENSNNDDIQNYLYVKCKILEKMTSWILSLIKDNKSDFQLLDDTSTILKTVIGYQDRNEQQNIIETYLSEILTSYKLNGHTQDKVIILLDGLLLRLRPDVEIPEKYDLIRDLLQLSGTIAEDTYLYVCKLVANLINKCNEDENLLNILDEIESYISVTLENNSNATQVKNIIRLISWITKSLIVKGSDKAEIWTDKMIALLDIHEDAGKNFKLIMDDSHDCLSAKSYCSNRLLYRQKFFAYVCKKLSSSYTENTPNHLLALGYLLQLAPQQVIILYFKETLRLLIFCLELCKDAEVLCAVLNTLCTLILTKEPYLENYIEDLLPRFLHLTKFEASMKVRIAALKCLENLPNAYQTFRLLPHKQAVIFGLSMCLDDKKRLCIIITEYCISKYSPHCFVVFCEFVIGKLLVYLFQRLSNVKMSDSFSLSQEIIAPDTFIDVVQELGTGANELLAAVQKDETVFYDEPAEYNVDQKNFLNWNVEQQYEQYNPSPLLFHIPQPAPPQIPANVDYAGDLDFNILISSQTASRNSWIYSDSLQKVYINMHNVLPIDVKRNFTNKPVYLRARMLFSLPQYAQEMVERCSAHIEPKNVDPMMLKHVLWCSNTNSIYQGNTELNEHLSVVTLLGEPQAGMETVRVNYKFMCKNSCPSGMNRRPVDVIFTLEDRLGNVLGRRKLAVRVCSCPKRDKEKEEKEYKDSKTQDSRPASSHTRKRKMVPVPKLDDQEDNMNFSSDDTIIEIPSFPVIGRQTAELILTTARNRMYYEIHATHMDEAKRIKIKKCLDEINNIYKNLLPTDNDKS